MIARKTWREVRVMALVYFLLLELLLLGAILFWPELAENIERLEFIQSIMPAEFLKSMVGDWSSIGYPAYIATQQFFKGVNIVGIASAVLLGTGAIAREREAGTLELLLSRPVSRSRILWSKCWVLALSVTAPIFLSSLSVAPLSPLVGESVAILPLMHGALHSSLFCLLFLALAICLSCFLKSQVHVAFAVGGFIVIEVGLYFIQVVRAASIFRLSDHDTYAPILAGNRHIDDYLANELGIVAGILVLLVVARTRFKTMDV